MKRVLSTTSLRSPQLWLLVMAVMLLLATFANPQIHLGQNSFRYVFVFDITQSMYVRDAGGANGSMSRIAHAIAATKRTINTLVCGSEVAIGIFSQHRSYLLITPVEVCRNFDELMRMLDRVDARMAWRSRSEIAKGIYSAIHIISELNGDARLVFFTDGHEAPPVNFNLRSSFETASYGVQGVIVGVGGSTPLPIPKFDLNGKPGGYWSAKEVMQIDPYSRGRDTGTGHERMVGVDYSDVASRIENGREHLSALRQPYLLRLSEELMLNYRRLDSASGLAGFLKQSQIAGRKRVSSDVRWVFAGLGLLVIIAVYLYEPLISSIRSALARSNPW